jgi:hypothetical protein
VSLKEVAEAAWEAEKQKNAARLLGAQRDAKKKPRIHSERVVIEGHAFQSKWEGMRYLELCAMRDKGLIRRLEPQRPFALVVNEIHVCDYVADFVYDTPEKLPTGLTCWNRVVEDAKGFKTEIYRLKKKLVRACLGIRILETRSSSREGRE